MSNAIKTICSHVVVALLAASIMWLVASHINSDKIYTQRQMNQAILGLPITEEIAR